MALGLRAGDSTLDAITRLVDDGLSPQELIEQVAERVERVVPSDGYFLAATDPETTLSIGMGVVGDLPADQCRPAWEYEFLVPDFLKFADIARSGRAVADIHDATGGVPERSPRFREFSASTGYQAEVRIAFTIGEAAWGIGQLDRAGAGARFSEDEKAWLERAAPLIARGLRRALLSPAGGRPRHPAAGDRGPRPRRARGVHDPRSRPVARRVPSGHARRRLAGPGPPVPCRGAGRPHQGRAS